EMAWTDHADPSGPCRWSERGLSRSRTSWGGRVATHGRRFTVAAFAAAVLALLVSAAVLVAGAGGSDFGRYYSDLSQLAAASAAAVTAGVTGLRNRGRSRAMWLS